VDRRICGCCVWISAGISVRVRVRDGVRISNRVKRRVKLVNYSLITSLPIATSAHPLFTRGRSFAVCKMSTVCSYGPQVFGLQYTRWSVCRSAVLSVHRLSMAAA